MTKKGRRKHHSCVLILNIEKQIFCKITLSIIYTKPAQFWGRKKENLSIDNPSHNRHQCHSE